MAKVLFQFQDHRSNSILFAGALEIHQVELKFSQLNVVSKSQESLSSVLCSILTLLISFVHNQTKAIHDAEVFGHIKSGKASITVTLLKLTSGKSITTAYSIELQT
jgi:hypothetical protein